MERIYHGNAFAEAWVGLFLIRGENVVLLGEIVRGLLVFQFNELSCARRILIVKTRFLYGKWSGTFWNRTTSATMRTKSIEKTSKRRSYRSRRGSPRRGERGTAIEQDTGRFITPKRVHPPCIYSLICTATQPEITTCTRSNTTPKQRPFSSSQFL